VWGVGELPHANRHIRQESPRECLWKNIATSIAAVQYRQPQHITMFGPFRLTNPLSGGLLWCDSLYFPGYPFVQLLVFALTFSTPMHSLLSPARYLDMNADKTTGRYHGASLDTRSTDIASVYDTSTPWSAHSIPHYDAWGRA
jgi:hypothetical protein